jgi:hypothetical protein
LWSMPWPVPCSILWPAPPAKPGRRRRPSRDRGQCRVRSYGQLHQIQQRKRAGAVFDAVARWPAPPARAGRCCRLVMVAVGALAGAVFDAVALICWPGDGCGQFHQQGRAGVVALVVIVAGVVLDAVARRPALPDPASKGAGVVALVVLDAVALICWPSDGCGQLHQQGRAGAAVLVVVAVGALAGVVLDPVASSASFTSEGGPVLLPWS